MSSQKLCANCGHPDKEHCKGGEAHSNYKEDARMIAAADRKHTVVCVSRHCRAPLCCCTAFETPPKICDVGFMMAGCKFYCEQPIGHSGPHRSLSGIEEI